MHPAHRALPAGELADFNSSGGGYGAPPDGPRGCESNMAARHGRGPPPVAQ